jgi:hypothetical protein
VKGLYLYLYLYKIAMGAVAQDSKHI